jgi:cytochrome P450
MNDRRKSLSGAFFKSRLVGMTEVIRKVTLEVIKDTIEQQKVDDQGRF